MEQGDGKAAAEQSKALAEHSKGPAEQRLRTAAVWSGMSSTKPESTMTGICDKDSSFLRRAINSRPLMAGRSRSMITCTPRGRRTEYVRSNGQLSETANVLMFGRADTGIRVVVLSRSALWDGGAVGRDD